MVSGLSACRPGGGEDPGLPRIFVGNQSIEVEVVATPERRRQGLMFRESLQADRGMLFVFPAEQVLGFWMRNTSIPLSIAYADRTGLIVRIVDLVPHSDRSVSSRFPALYALEVNRGWFERHGVREGDTIRRIPRVEVR